MTSRARNLGLAGVVLAGAGAISSCTPLGAVLGAAFIDHEVTKTNRSRERAARINADGERDASRIASGGNPQNYYNSLPPYIYKAFNSMDDLDNDGMISMNEIKGDKQIFSVDEPLFICLLSSQPILGLSYTLLRDGKRVDYRTGKGVYISSCGGIYNDPRNNSSKPLPPGRYVASWQNETHLLGIMNLEIVDKIQ